MKEYLPYQNALEYAMHYASKAEKCKADILKKLKEKNADPSRFNDIIEILIKNRFIDDSRFAKIFTREKFKFNKWGKIKIKSALAQKKIPDEIINDALSQINEEEYFEMLKNVISSKSKILGKSKAYSNKDKLFRHAASKGFEINLISKILNGI